MFSKYTLPPSIRQLYDRVADILGPAAETALSELCEEVYELGAESER